MFDGDADRVGFVDEKGSIHIGDDMLVFLAQDYLPNSQGAKVIVEITNSEKVIEEVKRLGGVPIWSRSGSSFIRKKFKKSKLCLAERPAVIIR